MKTCTRVGASVFALALTGGTASAFFNVAILSQQWHATASHFVNQPPHPVVEGGFDENRTATGPTLWHRPNLIRALPTNPTSYSSPSATVISEIGTDYFRLQGRSASQQESTTVETVIQGTTTNRFSARFELFTTLPVTVEGSVIAAVPNSQTNAPDTVTRAATFRLFDASDRLIVEFTRSSAGNSNSSVNLRGNVPNLSAGVYRFESVTTASWDISERISYSSSRAEVNFVLIPAPGAAGILGASGLFAFMGAARRRRTGT